MTEQYVKIELNGDKGSLVLGGHDLSKGIKGFTLRGGHDLDMPELIIEPLVVAGSVYAGSAVVLLHLADEARQVLIQEGWTPPNGEPRD